MKTIDKILEEKEYRQDGEHHYTRLLKNSEEKGLTGEYTYFTNNNNLVSKTYYDIPTDEWQKRCLSWFGDNGYSLFSLGEFARDTNVIIYNYYNDFYFIYSYKKVGLGGFGEYLMIKDDTNYDIKNPEIWEELSISEEDAKNILSWISELVHFYTDKQGGLSGTVSGPEVYYNEELTSEIYYAFKPFNEEIKELTALNICPSTKNDLYNMVIQAFRNDNYEELSKLVDDEMYIGGFPLITEAIMGNNYNILDKLINNQNCINQPDLVYKGRPFNYAILKLEDKKDKLKYAKIFIEKKCDYNAEDICKRNILYDAIETNDNDIFDLIYNLTDLKIDNTPENDGSNVLLGVFDTPDFIGNEKYLTPLQYACVYENYYAVQKMLTKENVNYANVMGNCLFVAIASQIREESTPNKYKIIELLLEFGADPHWKTEDKLFSRGKSIEELLEHHSDDKKLMDIMNKYL